MDVLGSFAFALLTGLTVAGITGSMLELISGRQLGFASAFAAGRLDPRFWLAAMAAGPLMLANDALEAWRGGHISGWVLVSCGLTALVWSTATGIVVIGLVGRLFGVAG